MFRLLLRKQIILLLAYAALLEISGGQFVAVLG